MTEFRTRGKGKDRQAYPVKGRKPFGISRELAYSDVEKLRTKGERARLIETNRRLELYAPFVPTILNEDGKSIRIDNEEKKTLKEPGKTAETNGNGLSMPNVKAIRRMKSAEKSFDMFPSTILNEDGKSILASVDNSHIMAAWITLPSGVDAAEASEFNEQRQVIRLPALDYGSDSTEIMLNGREVSNIRILVKDLLKELKADSTTPTHRKSRFKADDISILFTKPDSGKYGYAVVMINDAYALPDESKHYTRVMRVEMGSMPSGEMARYNPGYFLDSFRLFNEISDTKGDRNAKYRVTVKPDYPLLLSLKDPEGKKITQLKEGVVVAPMMTDNRDRKRAENAINRFTGGQ